ncbi:MAG TPA: serine/threonine-protein kinase [Candidatus Methylacidiphilales bacterium]|nr:serine/threonine-protein kinase [Candidatus Methylacidiphilales bacterium]
MPSLVQKIEPGDVIGRCRIIRELGRGGVGTVYLAAHQTLQIEVALKVLSPSLSMDNPGLAERFIREAQLAARIRHPNVIAVMDAAHDETTGLYYIVMEYVGGGSLSWHLRHGPLPEAKALAIVTGIANALVIAEENRIVHRDIKPDNIILDLRGTAKLADLGLAKHEIDSRLTLTLGGSFMGTPAYMSPEQARDAKIADTRDDIYSLGASFYECLTGQPPFQGENPYNIMSELLTKPSPKPRALRPDASRSADLICRKMMAKTRDLRYAGARALLHDLQHAQVYGDSGLDRLEAAGFDHDSITARQQELNYGIETSSEGVYAEPPDDPPAPSLSRPAPAMIPPRRTDYGVFGAAALLIGLVIATTLLLAWTGPNQPLLFLKNEWAHLSNKPTPQQPTPNPSVEKEKTGPVPVAAQESHTASTENQRAPVAPNNPLPAPTPVAVAPIPAPAPPVNPAPDTNVIPANPALPIPPIPALAVVPDSAFVARGIAETNLPPADIAPTGKAELLKIIGKRDETQITPTTWTFYFFDKDAAGHARIITVNAGKIVKTGEDLVDFASPYADSDVLAEEQLVEDSTDALQIAQGLIPGVTVTGSEFTLTLQKNAGPMWNVKLWTKNAKGEEHKLGDVTLRAENGTPNSINLKP